MARDPEKNALVREARQRQILDAALSVYIRLGYHGTDMDAVAEEARIAKGLLYYYCKTKKELFAQLYAWMFHETYAFSASLLEETQQQDPIERLMRYAYGMFDAGKTDPRLIPFTMRVPFDAYAIFGPEGWREGAEKSDVHRRALAHIIADGMAQGLIPATNPSSAANSFWSVFVGNAFDYAQLMMGRDAPREDDAEAFRRVVRFCFQGLGVDTSLWNGCLEKVIKEP